MMKINKTKLQAVIQSAGHTIFHVDFVKKDRTPRRMNARLQVHKGLKGGENKVVRPDNDYITVFSMQDNAFRTVNLDTITALKVRGTEYEVV
jgi:hypothetical protein